MLLLCKKCEKLVDEHLYCNYCNIANNNSEDENLLDITKIKGMECSIYTTPGYSNCSNYGASSYTDKIFLVWDDGFEYNTEGLPMFKLVSRKIFSNNTETYLYAEPYFTNGKHWMAGGNFVKATDSRFPCKYPISLHDRTEKSDEQYFRRNMHLSHDFLKKQKDALSRKIKRLSENLKDYPYIYEKIFIETLTPSHIDELAVEYSDTVLKNAGLLDSEESKYKLIKKHINIKLFNSIM